MASEIFEGRGGLFFSGQDGGVAIGSISLRCNRIGFKEGKITE